MKRLAQHLRASLDTVDLAVVHDLASQDLAALMASSRASLWAVWALPREWRTSTRTRVTPGQVGQSPAFPRERGAVSFTGVVQTDAPTVRQHLGAGQRGVAA